MTIIDQHRIRITTKHALAISGTSLKIIEKMSTNCVSSLAACGTEVSANSVGLKRLMLLTVDYVVAT